MNISDLLQFKYPTVSFVTDIILLYDDKGELYISHWNEELLGPKPTPTILDQWAIELEPVKQVQDARQNRRNEYLPMGDQLDAILKYFEVKEAQGEVLTPELKAAKDQWRAIKDKYPLTKS